MPEAADTRKALAKGMLELGLSYSEVAKRIGVSHTTVLRWFSPAKRKYDRAFVRPARTDYHREYQRKRRAALNKQNDH